MHLEFEPHSWYMGFAVRVVSDMAADRWGRNIWLGVTDNGNTYRIDELSGNTLKELKHNIRKYHLDHKNGYGERIAAGRLEYLRGEIEAEQISYGEIAELMGLTEYIKSDDVQLLQWANVPEKGAE